MGQRIKLFEIETKSSCSHVPLLKISCCQMVLSGIFVSSKTVFLLGRFRERNSKDIKCSKVCPFQFCKIKAAFVVFWKITVHPLVNLLHLFQLFPLFQFPLSKGTESKS